MRDMLGRGQAVTVDEALRLTLENLPGKDIPEEEVSITESFGRILSREVVSAEDVPGFPRSTMDGYAVFSGDTFGASETAPAYLKVTHEIRMGQAPDFKLERGGAARIATGGMLPDGADAVVMFEHAQELDGAMIEVQRAAAPGDNVIRRGEDVRAGDTILGKGRRLRPHDVAVLAGAGASSVRAFKRPLVSIISTGDEILPVGAMIEPGKVRDMNSLSLAGMVLEDGGIPVRGGIVRDRIEELVPTLQSSLAGSDMVLISGGSSVGSKDLTEKVVSGVGRILFHSVSIKPGKPLMAAMAGGKPVFGLPGHPRAVSVCYGIFIRPVMERLSGLKPDEAEKFKNTVTARLAKSVSSSPGRQEIISVALREENGELLAEPLLGKSGLLSTLVRADGTITVTAGKPGLQRGEAVRVRLL